MSSPQSRPQKKDLRPRLSPSTSLLHPSHPSPDVPSNANSRTPNSTNLTLRLRPLPSSTTIIPSRHKLNLPAKSVVPRKSVTNVVHPNPNFLSVVRSSRNTGPQNACPHRNPAVLNLSLHPSKSNPRTPPRHLLSLSRRRVKNPVINPAQMWWVV